MPMSDPEPLSTSTSGVTEAPPAASNARAPEAGAVKAGRRQGSVHRLDGGLVQGESDAWAMTGEGFPIYPPPDLDRARWIPVRDIKYVVFGSVEDPNLEADPGDNSQARKAMLRFRDGEWIAAYRDAGQPPDGAGLAIKIRLTERQRVIPAIAASPALLEMQFVDNWAAPTPVAQPQRRRSDIMEAAARQGRDLSKLANDFRDRLALIRDVGLTTGDTLAFSRAVRTHLDRFLAEDGIELSAPEKTTLADIILRAAVGYGPLGERHHGQRTRPGLHRASRRPRQSRGPVRGREPAARDDPAHGRDDRQAHRRPQPHGGRAPSGRQPGERDHPARGDPRCRAHDPQVQGRGPWHGRRKKKKKKIKQRIARW